MPLRHASAKPQKGDHQRAKAALDRLKAKADKLVYAKVDARDGLKSRLSGVYCGKSIERHHIRYRSLGGPTTTANVISLTQAEHQAVHAGKLGLSCIDAVAGANGDVVFIWGEPRTW